MIKYKTARMSENLRSGLTVFDDRCYVRQICTIALSTIKSITFCYKISSAQKKFVFVSFVFVSFVFTKHQYWCVLVSFVTKSVQLKKV